jgi:hypothetical protein
LAVISKDRVAFLEAFYIPACRFDDTRKLTPQDIYSYNREGSQRGTGIVKLRGEMALKFRAQRSPIFTDVA